MANRLPPQGSGASGPHAVAPGPGAPARRPYGLSDGAHIFRKRSAVADAQRRYNAAADQDERLAATPLPDPPPQGGREQAVPNGEERATAPSKAEQCESTADQRRRAAGWCGRPPGEVELSLLTHRARALYEGGVVPVRALARLCGVSLRTLYHHVHQQGWQRRRAGLPRDAAKSERQRQRYRARKAGQPASPRGLKARDPAGQAQALARAERAGALAGAALAKAIARQDAEAQTRMLALLTRAMRDLAIAKGVVVPRPTPKPAAPERKPRRRPYQWRPHGMPPAWAERR